ncbi:unnamed protein product, partial [Sphacelaria rigidula]
AGARHLVGVGRGAKKSAPRVSTDASPARHVVSDDSPQDRASPAVTRRNSERRHRPPPDVAFGTRVASRETGRSGTSDRTSASRGTSPSLIRNRTGQQQSGSPYQPIPRGSAQPPPPSPPRHGSPSAPKMGSPPLLPHHSSPESGEGRYKREETAQRRR